MNAERKEEERIELLISEALGTEPSFQLSPDFTDRLVKKLERHLAWKEIFSEFAAKIGIVTGILIILLICLFLPFLKEGNPFLIFLAQNRPLVLSAGLVALFIFFADQVLLRYLFRKHTATS
jgi:hypothetical protein